MAKLLVVVCVLVSLSNTHAQDEEQKEHLFGVKHRFLESRTGNHVTRYRVTELRMKGSARTNNSEDPRCLTSAGSPKQIFKNLEPQPEPGSDLFWVRNIAEARKEMIAIMVHLVPASCNISAELKGLVKGIVPQTSEGYQAPANSWFNIAWDEVETPYVSTWKLRRYYQPDLHAVHFIASALSLDLFELAWEALDPKDQSVRTNF